MFLFFFRDIGEILVCVDNIKECDTTGVLPLFSVASDDQVRYFITVKHSP
jgi:hypothetical protein